VIGPWPLGPAVKDSGATKPPQLSDCRPVAARLGCIRRSPSGPGRPPTCLSPAGPESGSLVQPLLDQNVKSNAVRQRRPYDNSEMRPDLGSYLRTSQGYPDIVRSYVRQGSATLRFEMKPSYSTPEYAAIALTGRCWGVVRDPACVASASPSYGPAVRSARALLIISSPDRKGGYRFFRECRGGLAQTHRTRLRRGAELERFSPGLRTPLSRVLRADQGNNRGWSARTLREAGQALTAPGSAGASPSREAKAANSADCADSQIIVRSRFDGVVGRPSESAELQHALASLESPR
jgi:hypothetical protein